MFVSQGSQVTLKTPISFTNYTADWFPSMPPMSGSWPSAYAGIYSRQLWVYVVVSKLAKGTARLPLPVYERNDLDRPRRDDHPMAKLLAKPNEGLSGFDLMLWTSSTFDIYGDTFWLKKRFRGQVVSLHPLHPNSMMFDLAKGTWRFDNGTLVLNDIPDGDLVHFRAFHPESTTRGLSPLEPLRATLENEWNARTATSSFWQRGARPGMALSHPGILSEPAQERLKAQMDSVSAGSDKTGVTVVLEEGMKPEVMTLTAEEAQYIETRKLNREEVCAAYDVPPPVVHILDRATFSNITEQMRSMYRDTMAPRLKGIEAAIELDLRQAEWPDDDVYAEFLMDDVLRGDFESRQDALNKASHMTIAEKRKVENLPFIDGTDRIFLNTATLPLDAIDAQADAMVAATAAGGSVAPPVAAPDENGNVIPFPVARSVLGRLSWQASLGQVDTSAITTGLDSRYVKAIAGAVAEEKATGGSISGLRDRLRELGGKAPADVPHHERVRRVLASFFRRQPDLNPDVWDADLTDDLHTVALEVSTLVGRSTAAGAGFDPDKFSPERTANWLRAVSARLAVSINDTTRRQLAATDDPSVVYADAEQSRAPGIAVGVATLVTGFAATDAGKQLAESDGVAPTKTWVTGPNPRAVHAALDGETVGIDETFSNGAEWPGDDGEPGCNCSVDITFGEA